MASRARIILDPPPIFPPLPGWARVPAGDGMGEACLNLQAELQPKLVSGGCQNF